MHIPVPCRRCGQTFNCHCRDRVEDYTIGVILVVVAVVAFIVCVWLVWPLTAA